ncbi:hydantoinase/oxoprolinase family protein [Siccirubricoccus phaeus]|uniref:hydantoinase/oxoprolinase family protein n=1 Tax=Siccirubricoccus phaeus TaxID=2595053 RepID=UPI00165A3C68|nr:hydantoinase/oxoprolinase family protein [Siccirubricoccus phaeus]
MLWLGIDVGGTFTDLVLYDAEAGRLQALKVPSTPADQSEGMLTGIRRLGLDPARLTRLAHGTTVATNTALEGTGARIAALVTAGHGDVLVVGRGNRTVMYDIKAPPPPPVVPRDRLFEVRERMLASGEVLRPLDEAQLAALAERLRAEGANAIALCFLHSYANPAHEQRAAAILRAALPEAVVASSAEVLPEYREHERFSTTALNAAVAPRMRHYLGGLRRRLAELGATAELSIMTSGGGTLPAARIEALPVLSMLSGPAAGVIAARFVGTAIGYPSLITCDMGGTSTDVAVIRDGGFGMTQDGRIGPYPVKIRQIDINTIGAGGGSIAAVDAAGTLTVGPRSAGAMPGPACYGRCGVEPTVTDANLALGRLGGEQALGGEIRLDRAAAEAAVARLGARIDLGTQAMAEGILRMAVIGMTGAIKEVSVMRGLDPRDFALLAYGGAGPLHAAAIAEELGMRIVLVPPMPGNFSALGLLVADIRRDLVRTRLGTLGTLQVAEVREVLAALVAEAAAELAASGVPEAQREYEAVLDMRFTGQAFELAVPVALAPSSLDEIEAAFHQVYAARYGAAPAGMPEIVSYRIAAFGRTETPALPLLAPAGRSLAAAHNGTRLVGLDGATLETPVLMREKLPLDQPIPGPALVEEAGSCTVVPPGWTLRLLPQDVLVLERG